MKKVMIIGKLNEIIKQLCEKLTPFCRPQICVDNQSVIQGMLKMLEPDVVVVSLDGMDCAPGDIFFLLERDAYSASVIAVGSVEMQGRLIKERYLPNKRIMFLQSPIETEDIFACVKKFLPQEAQEKEPAHNSKKILVVDDDPTTLRIIQNMLSGRCTVSVATSGSQAIMAVSRSKPDLIFLDYDMPVVDGKMTLQMLRSEEATRDIPVVFLTGVSDPAYVKEVLSLQPQGYLLKPSSEQKIFSLLTSILGEDAFA